jgi:hypothetical protein
MSDLLSPADAPRSYLSTLETSFRSCNCDYRCIELCFCSQERFADPMTMDELVGSGGHFVGGYVNIREWAPRTHGLR